MHDLKLIPQDVLFMGDSRPMAGADIGYGANIPRPDQVYAALHAAMLKAWPEIQQWEGSKHDFRSRDKQPFLTWKNNERNHDRNPNSSMRFGGLHIRGPFICKGGELYLPCPLDVGMRVVPNGEVNMPSPLTHSFLSYRKNKASLPLWIKSSDFARYLAGEDISDCIQDSAPLFTSESRIGIAINADSATTKSKSFYQARYLRMEPDAALCVSADCFARSRGVSPSSYTDVVDLEEFPRSIILGGQGGVCNVAKEDFSIPVQPEPSSKFLRWTLLTPALYSKGWIPGWIGVDGQVTLPGVERTPGMSRSDWKAAQKNASPIGARLIAARIGKAISISGWDQQQNVPRASRLAVPAGSSYVFECKDEAEARSLARILSPLRPHSDLLGEKGYGYGICSSITIQR